jgi:FkbM family methyltransferase
MKRHLKTIAARLPKHWQQELKRVYFRRQVRRRRFGTWEPEYALLPRFVARGDWVLDVGANVGHYTLRAAELVGTEGRVIALEPVPDTFALLAANAAARSLQNVTLINAAASASGHVAGMNIPEADTGLAEYALAHLTAQPLASEPRVLCLPIDALPLPHRIRLVKIDAERHELYVLQGMKDLLHRDHPIVIAEDNVAEVPDFLRGFGYFTAKLTGSSNRLFAQERSLLEAVRRGPPV